MATPAWQDFEMLIADIQKQMAPQAYIQHNCKIRGRSGRLRQLDVTLTQKIGLVDVLVVFECKRYTRMVGIEKVEAFVAKLQDVGASTGVMISATGFDAGAKAVARQYSILLLTCREAEDADWQKIVGIDAWFTFVVMAHHITSGTINFVHENDDKAYPIKTKVYVQRQALEADYEEVGTIESIAIEILSSFDPPVPVGTSDLNFGTMDTLYVRDEENWRQVLDLNLRVSVTAKAYPLNLQIAEGKVLEQDGDVRYVQAASEGIDWAEIMRTQPSTDLTQEALEQLRDHAHLKLQMHNLHQIKRFVRLVLTHKK